MFCLLVVSLFAGCANLPLKDGEKVALQIIAQRVGYAVALKNPAIVPQATLVAQGIVAVKDGDVAKTALNLAITALANQFPNDPLLESDLRLLAAGLNLTLPTVPLDTSQIDPIMAAFINGMNVGVK